MGSSGAAASGEKYVDINKVKYHKILLIYLPWDWSRAKIESCSLSRSPLLIQGKYINHTVYLFVSSRLLVLIFHKNSKKFISQVLKHILKKHNHTMSDNSFYVGKDIKFQEKKKYNYINSPPSL